MLKTTTTTLATTTANYCQSVFCGKNAYCSSDSVSNLCNCNDGYYGNANYGGDCEQDLGATRFIYPLVLVFNIPFDTDLTVPTSDHYKRARRSFEQTFFYVIFYSLGFGNALLGVQLQNFQYVAV